MVWDLFSIQFSTINIIGLEGFAKDWIERLQECICNREVRKSSCDEKFESLKIISGLCSYTHINWKETCAGESSLKCALWYHCFDGETNCGEVEISWNNFSSNFSNDELANRSCRINNCLIRALFPSICMWFCNSLLIFQVHSAEILYNFHEFSFISWKVYILILCFRNTSIFLFFLLLFLLPFTFFIIFIFLSSLSLFILKSEGLCLLFDINGDHLLFCIFYFGGNIILLKILHIICIKNAGCQYFGGIMLSIIVWVVAKGVKLHLIIYIKKSFRGFLFWMLIRERNI